jgi:hypothetical protein
MRGDIGRSPVARRGLRGVACHPGVLRWYPVIPIARAASSVFHVKFRPQFSLYPASCLSLLLPVPPKSRGKGRNGLFLQTRAFVLAPMIRARSRRTPDDRRIPTSLRSWWFSHAPAEYGRLPVRDRPDDGPIDQTSVEQLEVNACLGRCRTSRARGRTPPAVSCALKR